MMSARRHPRTPHETEPPSTRRARQVSDAAARGQLAEDVLRRQAWDAKGRRQAAENEARHQLGDAARALGQGVGGAPTLAADA
jgi:hypothetical protein